MTDNKKNNLNSYSFNHFPDKIDLPSEVCNITQVIAQNGGKVILVGGSIRDYLFGVTTFKDLDIEVYNLSLDKLEKILINFGKVQAVGKSFGVLKLKTEEHQYDFSFPRKESKIGKGHKGFIVEHDTSLSFEKAAYRRDFTINSMGYDIVNERFLDPFNGIHDLKLGILRHVSPAFSEDPLRILRAMQFVGRFEFNIDPETVLLCNRLDLNELPKERLFEEFKKLLLKAERPSFGFKAAKKLGILDFFPEMKALLDVPQDPEWHPEGDVWIHTLMVIDEAAKMKDGDEKADLELMFGALCHDFGKPLTTQFINGRWRSPKHDEVGLEPTETFLRQLTDENSLIEKVKIYVREHLKPALLYKDKENVTDGAIRRLSLRIPISDLIRISKADHFGTATAEALARKFPPGDWLLERATQLKVKKESPKPVLLGRHLLQLGMTPSPQIGIILKEAFDLQLEGKLQTLEDALDWVKKKEKVFLI